MDFKNQALLTYGNKTVSSNIVEGTIVSPFTIRKFSPTVGYTPNDQIAYTIVVTNGLNIQLNNSYVFDSLGTYDFNGEIKFPLDFDLFSATLTLITDNRVYGGILGVSERTDGVLFSFIFPANTTAVITYSANVTRFANPNEFSSIDNTVTFNVPSYEPVVATNSIGINAYYDPVIAKLAVTENVTTGAPFIYKFVVLNYGNIEVSPEISDVINPLLSNISLNGNGTQWTEGVNYTYNTDTGLLTVSGGTFTVPPATFTQNTQGEWSTTPSSFEITITGIVVEINIPQS